MEPSSVLALAVIVACFTTGAHAQARNRTTNDAGTREQALVSKSLAPQDSTLRGGYSARNVLGLPVRAFNAEHVGTIEDIALDRKGRVLALVLSTPERTHLRLAWQDAAIDLLHGRVTVSAPLAEPAALRPQPQDANIAPHEVVVLVQRLLGSKASVSGDASSGRIDDVILSRNGYAGTLVVEADTNTASPERVAHAFPSQFGYDAMADEFVIPGPEQRGRPRAFSYVDLGILPPERAPGVSRIARPLVAATRSGTHGSAIQVPTALSDTAGNGCWARIFNASSYRGKPLTLVGPIAMPQLKEHWGYAWNPQFDSVMVGSKATLTLYENRQFHRQSATFAPGQRIADLDRTMGRFRTVRSLTLECPLAQQ